MSQPPPVDKKQPGSLGSPNPSSDTTSRATLRVTQVPQPSGLGLWSRASSFLTLCFSSFAACCFCFSTDTCQKKNNSAPQRHFNNSYSTSVPTTLINKYLLEYNHFLLEWAVFRNEITIIVSKNMYEQQTFNLPGFVLWFMCIKAFPAAPLAFVLAKILLLIGFKPKSVCKKCYTQQPAHPRIHGK